MSPVRGIVYAMLALLSFATLNASLSGRNGDLGPEAMYLGKATTTSRSATTQNTAKTTSSKVAPSPSTNSEDESDTDPVANVISTLALAVAIMALIISSHFSRKQTGIQAQLRAIEEARRQDEVAQVIHAQELERRAQLAVDWKGEVEKGVLVILNTGPAQADDIMVSLEAQDGDREPPRLVVEGHRLPIPRLAQGQVYLIDAITFYGMAKVVRVNLDWKDGNGPHTEAFVIALT